MPNELGWSHRIRNPKTKKKDRPIIVKFLRYNLRHNIFQNNKSLRGKSVSITERLRRDRMAKLNETKETYDFRNVWTSDSKIIFKMKRIL